MDDFTQLQSTATELVKLSNGLPKAEAFSTQMLDRDVKARFDTLNAGLLTVLDTLMSRFTDGEVRRSRNGGVTGALGDFIDAMCDRMDDVIAPKKKAQESAAPTNTRESRPSGANAMKNSKNKIQSTWQPENYNYYTRFVPEGFEKLYAESDLSEDWQAALKNPEAFRTTPGPSLLHPYTRELANFDFQRHFGAARDGARLFELTAPIVPKRLRDTTLVYVDSEALLKETVEDILREEGEGGVIALDVEHHSERSFKGFTSLIQLSTREKDYIIDPFPVWKVLGQYLNQLTANPRILKVLHGSDSDVVWLQRDFGVYLVGVFDTFRAARKLLVTTGHSLAALLKVYCGVTLEKEEQRSDWSLRPLREAQLVYARQDTHHLIFLYECMKNHLLSIPEEKAGADTILSLRPQAIAGQAAASPAGVTALQEVLRNTHQVAATTYTEGPLDLEVMTEKIYKVSSGRAFDIQRDPLVMTALLKWRDAACRAADINTGYLLPDPVLARIAGKRPRTIAALLPDMKGVRADASAVLQVVLEALESEDPQAAANAAAEETEAVGVARRRARNSNVSERGYAVDFDAPPAAESDDEEADDKSKRARVSISASSNLAPDASTTLIHKENVKKLIAQRAAESKRMEAAEAAVEAAFELRKEELKEERKGKILLARRIASTPLSRTFGVHSA